MSQPVFRKATRAAARLKIGVSGPSGSGKTLGALAIAHVLAEGGKIALIDTENGSASLYADRYDFDALDIEPPYLTKKYLDAMTAAAEGGYSVLVIDTISHQWEGDGGILQRKDEADARPGSNHWTNWGPFTKEHNRFRAALLEYPMHIIATMRSKQSYAQDESGGKKKIVKMGLAPIQREGMEYEFTVTWDVQMDHLATASKDRTSLFADQAVDLTNPATAKKLLTWLGGASAVAVISGAQRTRLWTVAQSRGMNEDLLRVLVREICAVNSTKEIPLDRYNALVDAVEAWQASE